MNDSDKQVDEISDSEHLVVTRSNPKSNPNSDSKTATDTTNENFTHKLLISQFVQNIIPVVIRLTILPITVYVMCVQEILIPRQTVLPQASVTHVGHSCAHMTFVSNSILGKTVKFVDLGLSPADTTDKLKSVIGPATRYVMKSVCSARDSG